MVSSSFKPAVNRMIEPIARVALRSGLTPDMVTLTGTIGSIVSSIYLIPRGELFLASLVISFFLLSDLFDGAIARISERGATRWGGFLDSTCDRISDSALLGSLVIFCIKEENDLYLLILLALVLGYLVSYIRAKSESFGIPCTVGIAERTERLLIAICAIGFEGLGVPYALSVGIWILAIVSAITVLQRIFAVHRGLSLNG